MAEYKGLKYKLAGEGSPQGCPRVYFLCHPDDFFTYFDGICNEIFEIRRNIAFFYPADRYDTMDEPAVREAFLQDLSSMQLFVVPVTSKFLFDKQYARARELEFKYAMEKHIPILPLMQERGLEQSFNSICGDLQMLDKNNNDDTAIPYSEKLKRFIENILAGDELVSRIRAAFEAYIFLSYRKRDRVFAQQIMHLIHENPACRDVAIWYDEFLTPGENFSDSIRSAIEKSSLFALVVTPNLLEDENYVMQIEFPLAKEKGKDILPLEAVPTDPKLFKDKFGGAPDCVDPADQAALAKKIMESAMAIALIEPDNSPQHLFFIGLAYLGGIDVEVNREKALELITKAADEDFYDAYLKLISMYETGDGVERNYVTAAMWRRKQVDYLGRHCRETKKYKDWKAYANALWSLGDAFYELRMYAEAQKAYEEMQHAGNVLVKNGKEDDERYITVSYTKLANIAAIEGDHQKAVELLEKSLEYREKQIGSDNVTRLRDLAINYSKLATAVMALGRLEAAKENIQKAIEVTQKGLEIKPNDTLLTKDMSIYYSKLSGFVRREGRNEEARQYEQMSLDIVEKQSRSANATDEDLRNLSVELNTMGDMERAAGHFEKARELLRKALEIREKLFQKRGTIGSRQDLAVSYDRLGTLEKTLGNFPVAMELFETELEIFEGLLAEHRTVAAIRAVSDVHVKIAEVYEIETKYEEARAHYLECLKLREEVLTLSESIDARSRLATVRWSLGHVHNRLKKYDEAELHFIRALGIREQLYEETGLLAHRSSIASIYRGLAETYSGRKEPGDLEKSEEYFLKTIEARKLILIEDEAPVNLRNLGLAYTSLGSMYYYSAKDLDKSLEVYLKALPICEMSYEGVKSLENNRDLSICYRQIAMIYRDKGDTKKALEFFEKALERREKTYKEHPGTITKKDLTIIIKQIIDFAKKNGMTDLELDMNYKLNKIEGNN